MEDYTIEEEQRSSSDEEKETELELEVPMHCKACERSVLNALMKCEGVRRAKADMSIHRATVWGTAVNPEKVVKTLKKKAGKKAQVIIQNNTAEGKAEEKGEEEEEEAKAWRSDYEMMVVAAEDREGYRRSNQNDNFETFTLRRDYYFHRELAEDLSIFSDENPNSCTIV